MERVLPFHKLGASLAALVAIIALATGAATSQERKLIPLRVGLLKMASLTNPWTARRQGIFEKNGLDVSLIEFRSGNEAIAAQQGGSVDIVLAIPGTAMIAIERGFDLVAIAQNEVAKDSGPDTGSLQVLKDSDLKSVADLNGKTIAVSGLHSQKTVGLQMLLRKAGVDLKRVQLVEVPYPSHADALRSKQVDAVATVDPYTTQLLTSGVGRVLAWDYTDAIPEQPLGAWFAKKTFVQKQSDAIDRFNASIRESIDYMNANDMRARQEVVAYTGLDASLVQNMPLIGWDYRVKPSKWQAVIEMMSAGGELQKPHHADEYFSEQMKRFIVK